MPAGRNFYRRNFMVLQEEEKGYGHVTGRGPTGYCKIEVRGTVGRMSLMVQNLKPIEEGKGSYHCFFLAKTGGEFHPFHCGKLGVGNRGRGELNWEFQAEDVGGLDIDRYQAICVVYIPSRCRRADDIIFPLTGYRERGLLVPWKPWVAARIFRGLRGFQISSEVEEMPDSAIEPMAVQEELVEPEAEVVAEDYEAQEVQEDLAEPVAESYEAESEEVEPVAESYEAESVEAEPVTESYEAESVEAEPVVESYEAESVESEPVVESYEAESVEAEAQAIPFRAEAEYPPSYTSMTPSYYERVKGYFDKLFKEYAKIDPFEEAIPDSEWIQVRSPGTYPLAYQGYPYSVGYYSGYETSTHYIIGLLKEKGNIRYICYGVPGRYSVLPPAGLEGFYRWLPAKGYYGMGYWLMYLDAATGETVYPY